MRNEFTLGYKTVCHLHIKEKTPTQCQGGYGLYGKAARDTLSTVKEGCSLRWGGGGWLTPYTVSKRVMTCMGDGGGGDRVMMVGGYLHRVHHRLNMECGVAMWLARWAAIRQSRVRIPPGTPPLVQPRKVSGQIFPSAAAGDTSAAAGVSARHQGWILYQYL